MCFRYIEFVTDVVSVDEDNRKVIGSGSNASEDPVSIVGKSSDTPRKESNTV